MFALDDPRAPFVVPMLQQMFHELRAFGCLLVDQNLKKPQIEEYVQKRIRVLIASLQPLETMRGLRFQNAPIPYLDLDPQAPKDAPFAGYTDSTPVSPGSVVKSYAVSWMADAGAKRAFLLSAALYELSRCGLQQTVDYLFDLYDHGWMISSDDLVNTTQIILAVRSAVDSDEA